MKSGPSGFGVDVEGALFGAMSGLDHDLVVPTDSALSFGAPQGVLKCSHIEYFADYQVQSAIQNFVRPVAAPGCHAGTRNDGADSEGWRYIVDRQYPSTRAAAVISLPFVLLN